MKTAAALTLLLPAFALQDGAKTIQFEAPAAWAKEDPANAMRKAQYRVPDKEKKARDGEMVLFYFGSSAGTIPMNLKRWAGQMGQQDAKGEVVEGKCKITLVDLKGTYTERPDKEPLPDARMLAAVVETEAGPWYFKLTGPAETVGDWRDEFVAMLKAAKP
jgi:hypothetical protein